MGREYTYRKYIAGGSHISPSDLGLYRPRATCATLATAGGHARIRLRHLSRSPREKRIAASGATSISLPGNGTRRAKTNTSKGNQEKAAALIRPTSGRTTNPPQSRQTPRQNGQDMAPSPRSTAASNSGCRFNDYRTITLLVAPPGLLKERHRGRPAKDYPLQIDSRAGARAGQSKMRFAEAN